MIDGGAPSWPEWSEVATTTARARVLARELASSGRYDGLYAVQRVGPAMLRAIVDTAHEHGLPVTGQLWSTDALSAASVGIDQLDNNSRIFVSRDWPPARLLRYASMPERLSNMAHAWLSVDWDATSRVIDAMVGAGVTYCPTFVVRHDAIGDSVADPNSGSSNDDKDFEASRAWARTRASTQAGWTTDDAAAWKAALDPRIDWVSRFRARGGRVIAGTDMEFGPFAIDREIELLVQAGCGVAEAIGAATGASATALGIGNDTGTLETGKFADLVVLASDPEADIRAIGQVVAVVAGGERWAAAAVDHALPRSASASG